MTNPKRTLVIDYTELDFPLDGIKQNEGHVIAEGLRYSSLDHLVISTGKKEDSPFHNQKNSNRTGFNQRVLGKRCLEGEVISQDTSKQEVFDFENNWFKPEFLEAILTEYDLVVVNFNSISHKNLEITKKLKSLTDLGIKLNYTAHHPRLVEFDYLLSQNSNFTEFMGMMDSVIVFFDAVAIELGLNEEKVRRVKLGVDEEKYQLSTQEVGKTIVGTHIIHRFNTFYPINHRVIQECLVANEKQVSFVLDYTDQNRWLIEGFEQFTTWRNQNRLKEGNFVHDLFYKDSSEPDKANKHPEKLYLSSNPHANINLFLSPYNTTELSVDVLKA